MDGYVSIAMFSISWALVGAINSLPLVLIAGTVSLFCRKWLSPRVRFHVWTLVLIRMLLPISLESPFGMGQWFNYLPPAPSITIADEGTPTPQRMLPMPTGVTPQPFEGSQPEVVAVWDWKNDLLLLGYIVLPAISVLLAIWFLVASLRLLGFLARESESPEPMWEELLAEGCQLFGVRASVQIRTVEDWKVPATMGFFRPVILVPGSAKAMSVTEMKHVLWHELAHVKRGDAAWNWLWMTACCLQWWNPVFWWAQRYWLTERELACDAMAVKNLGSSATEYGRTLLHFLERLSQSKPFSRLVPIPGLVCFVGDKGAIRRRFEALASPLPKDSRVGRWSAFAFLMVVAVSGLSDAADYSKESTRASSIALPAGTVWQFGDAVTDATSDSESSVSTQVYDIDRVLARVRQDVRDAKAEWISSDILRCCGLFKLSDIKSNQEICTVDGCRMVVAATPSQHKKITQILEHWEKFGQQQICIEVEMISTDADLNKIVPMSAGKIVSPIPTREDDLMSSFENGQTIQQSIACPSFVRTMSTADVETAYQVLHRNTGKTARLYAPTVTIFSGSTANIMDARTRPFVTGLQTNAEGKTEPQVTNIDEGLKIAVNALVADSSGNIDLNIQVRHTQIADVEVLKTKIDGQSTERSIQIPHTTGSNFRMSARVSDGQTILVSPLRRDQEGKLHVCLITSRILGVQ